MINIKNNIKFYFHIINDSYVKAPLNETFITFKTVDNFIFLIYSSKNSLINCYDLIKLQKICEIKEESVKSSKYVNFKHYLDKKNKRDLVISIFCICDNIKMWNVKNWECVLNIENINNSPDLGCACFLNDKNKIYIITSCRNNKIESRPIKVFDFNGKKIKEINDSKEASLYIDSYYDNISLNNYIISSNLNHIKSYNFNKNELYHEYSDTNNNEFYCYTMVCNINNEIKLFSSCYDGTIRIFNFHSAILLKKIKINQILFRFLLWNKDYLFVGCGDNKVRIINLKDELIISELTGHNNSVVDIKKIILPFYGECIISQGKNYDKIILWVLDNK